MSMSFRGRLLAATISAGAIAASACAAHAETLSDALALAYENNPTLQAQRATQRALDETYVQARSGWRPTLNLSAGWAYGETATPALAATALGAIDRNGDGIPDGAGRSHSSSVRTTLNFSQPLWTGGRVAAQVNAANADILQGRENLRRVEAQVLLNVIQAYVDVRRDVEALSIRRADVEVLTNQLKESQARFDVGEVTRTDVEQSRARLAQSQALAQSADAQLAVSRATYAALVGQNPGELAPEPALAFLLPSDPDQAFDVALKNSPLLRGQEFAEQASRARVAGAHADRMPNVSAQATLDFRNQNPEDVWGRDYFSRGSSVGVNVTLPLFNGGLTSSRIRQAVQRNNADRINIETARRQVLQSITQSWSQMLAARANIVSSDTQVTAAQIAAEGTRQEQNLGLRTTIDVLNAEQELRQAQLNAVFSRHDEYVAAASVLSTMGRLEAKDLIPSASRYDAASNFRRLRLTWGWVPWEEPIAILDRTATVWPAPSPGLPQTEAPIPPGLQPPPAVPAAPASK